MSTQQYLRVCTLLVSTSTRESLDLSELRIKFAVKRSDTVTPNVADIRVYNVATETAKRIRKEFTRVILQAGYEGNFGVIFEGNIKQVILGRENSTDTFIDIIAGDGDRAFNFAVVNTTIAKGSTQADQIQAAMVPMSQKGVTSGAMPVLPRDKLPRGKVMYGNSREYLRNSAESTGTAWSIQNGKVNFIPLKSYLPGESVFLSSKTGMIGTPQQTNEGVNVKCLLNPRIRIGGRIQVNNRDVALVKINLETASAAANIAVPLTADGVYYVLVLEHQGDNRSQDWWTNIVGITVDLTTNPKNSVQPGFNGGD